tara:strand:- start:513 stop:2261 length:1749 start_codon:yes stop_codon:yes gene_type:complete
MIGPENIEEKIFQYFEGELSSNESLNLERFIKENPEYQVDFDAWRKSTIKDEKREYKFVDELLVNERFSPKGWLKWASGGVLFIGFILSSLVMIEKFDKGEEKVSRLKVNKNHLDVEKQNFIPEDKPLLIKTEKENKDLIHLTNTKSQNNVNISTKYNQLNSSFSKLKSLNRSQNNLSLKASSEDFNKSKLNSAEDDLEGDDKPILKDVSYSSAQKKNNLIQLKLSEHSIEDKNNYKKIAKSYYFPSKSIELESLRLKRRTYPSLRKENYSYENPNTPKLFFTNGKDPYLNYALAHTIEENGSFVGDFNNGEGIRAEMLYRTEWPSVTSENFTSQIISLDTKIDALKGGLGLLLNADRIGHGKLSSTAFSIIYSPKLMVKKISVEPSFKYTHNQKNIVWNQVQSNDVKDPRNGVLYASIPIVPNDILKTNLVHHDLGLGLLINTDKIYLGGQIDHLNNASYTQDNFDQNIEVPFKISAMMGTEIMKNKESQIRFSPSLNYIQFGVYNALWVNSQIIYHGLFFSGGFASNEELMMSLGYANNKVRLVYGLGFSKPREFSGLPVTGEYYESHQLSLRINLKPKK